MNSNIYESIGQVFFRIYTNEFEYVRKYWFVFFSKLYTNEFEYIRIDTNEFEYIRKYWSGFFSRRYRNEFEYIRKYCFFSRIHKYEFEYLYTKVLVCFFFRIFTNEFP